MSGFQARHKKNGFLRVMGKKTGNKSHQNAQDNLRVCRVSYSLNNDQPVRSTIIGDQPLFYMDFEDALEEELREAELLDDLDLGLSAHALPTYEDFRSEYEETAAILESFFENAQHLTQAKSKPGHKDMSILSDILAQSRFGAALLALCHEHGISFVYCGQCEGAAYLRDAKMVMMNPALPEEEQVLLLARELRRVWQHKNGVLLHPLTFHPDQAILVNRAQAADLTVSMIRTAWELQLSGYHAAWERIEKSPMSDLTRVFAREAYLDFRTLNNGLAMASTFEMWFLSERCRVYDKALIQQMLADYQGYMFEAEESSRTVTNDLIAALGSVPFGKNYLAQYAATIIADPVFADVRDRANANFLWFIKFEKSFRETEQELQHGTGPHDHAFLHDHPERKKETGHGSVQKIIAFPRPSQAHGENTDETTTGAACKARNASSGGNANIIAFPCLAGRETC